MIDIDDFKKINDTHGHVVGDHVLSKLSDILKKMCGGSGNVIARFGGEEFIALAVVNAKNEVLGLTGYTKDNLLFKIFNTPEDATQAKQSNDKVVRI